MTQIYEDGRFTRSVKIRESIFACMAPVAQGMIRMNVPDGIRLERTTVAVALTVAHMLALACT